MKIRLVVALVGLAISFALPAFSQQKEPTPSKSTPEVTPTPTLGDGYTQVLPDRRVAFRLLAPKANDVKVLIGVKSGTYESQGTTTTEMTWSWMFISFVIGWPAFGDIRNLKVPSPHGVPIGHGPENLSTQGTQAGLYEGETYPIGFALGDVELDWDKPCGRAYRFTQRRTPNA